MYRHDSGEARSRFDGRGVRLHAARAITKGRTAMQKIKQALHEADREARAGHGDLGGRWAQRVNSGLASTLRRLDPQDAERAALEGMYAFQRGFCESVWLQADEVGRGPVASRGGRRSAARQSSDRERAQRFRNRLPPEKRRRHREEVKEMHAWDIGHIAPAFIDEHGMWPRCARRSPARSRPSKAGVRRTACFLTAIHQHRFSG